MEDDFYCSQVLSGRTTVEVVHETASVLAFRHTRPAYPLHIVVIPKQHIPSFLETEGHDQLLLELLATVREVAAQFVREQGACRVITNLGRYQDSKHLHWHVVSGGRLV